MKTVAPLAAFGREDVALAGGKGANLGELIRAGFPVPDGFVVTTRADDGEDVRRAILDAYRGGPVAVRSSATAEDLPGAAFAGQQDTFLDVEGADDLLDAVRRCRASLWNERAVSYRERLGIPPDEVAIAVVVQEMVPASAAGVMFTADPVTGARDQVVVEAARGLGEAVVSGEVTPDRYVLDAAGRVLHGPAADPILSAAVLAELAGLGRRVAAHFGGPQDIEWALAAGTVNLVQARPMTAVPPPPVTLNRFERRIASVLTEYLPTRPYPIDLTTWIPYGPAGLMSRVFDSLGLKDALTDLVSEVDGVAYALTPRAPKPTLRLLRTPYRLLARARRFDPARWRDDPRFTGFLRRMRELAARDPATLSWAELVKVPREVFAGLDPVAALRIDYLPGAGVALARLGLALTLLGRRSLMADLLVGIPTRTHDANRALAALAERVRNEPGLRDRLTDDPDFHRILAEFGHRETASPILVTPPSWSDAPEVVADLVTMLAGQPPEPHADRYDQARRRLPGTRIQRLVERARAGVAFREDSHFYFTMPQPVLRRALVEMGRRLRGAGVCAEPEDVFHLRLEELEAIDDVAALDAAEAARLRSRIRARAARRRELDGVRMIDLSAVFPAPPSRGGALVSGTSACGGQVTGPVKVIMGPADFGRLVKGDVLVCPYTNPSWTPLFQRAAAVVTDAGGMASHAAIVAREYGLPAVMGTGSATSTLADGQLVTVNGDAGTVTLG